MKRWTCMEAGCSAIVVAEDEDELIEQVNAHVGEAHGSYELEDVIVTRFETTGGAGESVAFGYRLVRLTAGGATVCWDTSANMGC